MSKKKRKDRNSKQNEHSSQSSSKKILIPNSSQSIDYTDIEQVKVFESSSIMCPDCRRFWINPQNLTIRFKGIGPITHIGSYCQSCKILRISPQSTVPKIQEEQNAQLLKKINAKQSLPEQTPKKQPVQQAQSKPVQQTAQNKSEQKPAKQEPAPPQPVQKQVVQDQVPLRLQQKIDEIRRDVLKKGGRKKDIHYYRSQYSNAQLPPKNVQNQDFSAEISTKLNSIPAQEISYDDSKFKRAYLELEKKPSVQGTWPNIYLGIDFGTSFTKVAYQKDENNRSVISFGDSYFKNSILFYNTKSCNLSFFKPDDMDNVETIRFFKATMLDKNKSFKMLKKQHLSLPENPSLEKNFSLLCSAFFLANIIKYCTMLLREKFEYNELSICLGVPLLETDKNLTTYNKALHLAVELSNRQESISQIDLRRLYELAEDSWAHFNNNDYTDDIAQNCTMPEIFAETLYLLRQKNYGPGYYLIVDIGGGTADFAFIHKDNSLGKTIRFYCPCAMVKPLGNEIRKVFEEINNGNKYHTEFGKYYSSTIFTSKKLLQVESDDFEIQRLMFGGGAIEKCQPYQQKEKQNWYTQNLKGVFHKLQYRNIDDFQNPFFADSLNLKPEDKQRLITATQLANPGNRGKSLSGKPDSFSTDQPKAQKIKPLGDPGYDSIG